MFKIRPAIGRRIQRQDTHESRHPINDGRALSETAARARAVLYAVRRICPRERSPPPTRDHGQTVRPRVRVGRQHQRDFVQDCGRSRRRSIKDRMLAAASRYQNAMVGEGSVDSNADDTARAALHSPITQRILHRVEQNSVAYPHRCTAPEPVHAMPQLIPDTHFLIAATPSFGLQPLEKASLRQICARE